MGSKPLSRGHHQALSPTLEAVKLTIQFMIATTTDPLEGHLVKLLKLEGKCGVPNHVFHHAEDEVAQLDKIPLPISAFLECHVVKRARKRGRNNEG